MKKTHIALLIAGILGIASIAWNVPPWEPNRAWSEEATRENPMREMMRDLERAQCVGGARMFYSLWEGYFTEPRLKPFLQWLNQHGIAMQSIHASSHAPPADLRRFAKAINPKILVPMSSIVPEQFADSFFNVEQKRDGAWWRIVS